MLWFLHVALQRKFAVERCVDEAVGVLDRTWMSKVTLHPRVTFSGKAHEKCFIANPVKTEVLIEPVVE